MLTQINYARFEFHALRRIRNFLTLKEAKLLANSLVTTYFGYTSLIGIFTSKSSILKVTKIHWRTLHVVYDDYNSIYEELLDIHNDISIHQEHLKHLAIEVCKSLTNLNPEFMQTFFKNKFVNYNFRNENVCIFAPARPSHYGINSVLFRGSLLWNNLPISVKGSASFKEFKQKLNHATKDSLFLCCMSKILKLLSIMSVLVFVKLVFISLVTIVSLSRVARNIQPGNLKFSHLSKPTLLKMLDEFH